MRVADPTKLAGKVAKGNRIVGIMWRPQATRNGTVGGTDTAQRGRNEERKKTQMDREYKGEEENEAYVKQPVERG